MLDKALNQPEQSKDLTAYTDQYTLSMAIDRLRRELQKDKQPGSYYYAWQSNIAMAFYDVLMQSEFGGRVDMSTHLISEIANQAAINFLEILCQQNNTDSKKQNELQKSPPAPPKL